MFLTKKFALHSPTHKRLHKKLSRSHSLKHYAETDLLNLSSGITSLITSQDPLLETTAKYYFDLGGKRMRPLSILLVARALSAHRGGVLEGEITERQFTLAKIVEMIHTASIVHDDVIDIAEMRRGKTSVNVAFGNRTSVLSGDFLLARASVAMAKLRNFEVMELMSTIISDLVEGEFMQVRATKEKAMDFEYYMEKTYYKTASLIANGCRCTAILSDVDRELVENMTEYGKHIGLAFQLVDDVFDFVSDEATVGKPVGNDIKLGLSTAPTLYAAEEHPELIKLIKRNFEKEGDAERAYALVRNSTGIQRTMDLADKHCTLAKQNLNGLSNSHAKSALLELADYIMKRDK